MNAGSAAPSPDGLPLPGGPPPQSAPQLDEALDARWFGGDAAAASSRGNAEQQTSGMPERARGNGFLSWLFSWGGDGSSSSSGGGSKRGRRPAAARAGTQRPRPGAEGAVPAPLPRPKSAAKLQPGPGGSSAHVTPSNGAAAGTGPAPPQQPQQQPQQQQHPNPQQPADNKRRSTRSAAVQASYAARRQAWRQRCVLRLALEGSLLVASSCGCCPGATALLPAVLRPPVLAESINERYTWPLQDRCHQEQQARCGRAGPDSRSCRWHRPRQPSRV